jgi:tetratricopeptide (TPR) repeat protein
VQSEREPPPWLTPDRTVWNALRYSTRFWYVLKDFNHTQLISDVSNAGTLSRDQQAGHTFILRTLRLFLDAYVKQDQSAQGALNRSAEEHSLPAALAMVTDRAASLPPAPTGEEFEQLVMDGRVEDAARIYREAARANLALRLFDEDTIGLYAWRYSQRKQPTEALALRRLGAEAFPESPMAAYQLGVAAADARSLADARAAFARALQLLEASSMPQSRKDELSRDIQKSLAGLAQRH